MMSPGNRFRHIFWITAGVHVALIVGVLLWSTVRRWLTPKRETEIVTFVSLHTPAPPVEAAAVEEAPPPPPPEPTPRPRVQRSTERVRRDIPPPEPAPPRFDPEELRRQLEGAVETTPAQSGATQDDLAWYYSLIHQTLYQAWEQPGAVLPGTTATARIRVARDGSVTSRELVRRSGNSAMDQSVLRALQAVTRLRPLPRDIPGAHHDFTIEFELTGARL